MIDRTARRFSIKPRHLAADSAYGSAANLAWLVKERRIEPHIPVFDKSNRTDGTFSRSDFVFDAEPLHLPAGQAAGAVPADLRAAALGHYQGWDAAIPLKQVRLPALRPQGEMLPNTPQRKVPRDLDEDARDVARALANTLAYERSRHRRKKAEILFAHLKRILRLGRLRLRGPSSARDEFLLAATAQNLRKLAKLRAMPAACPVAA
jgi:hypothetical protein